MQSTSNKKAALTFIFVTLLIDCMGWGLIIPVTADLISQLKGIPANEASKYGGYLLAAYATMQFIFSPVIGNLSDRYGRRPVLLFALLGFGFDYIIQATAPAYGWLFLGRAVAGITGASFTTATAYIADISTDATDRAKNFGMVGAAFGLGFVLGPALGGFLASWGIRAPFWGAAVLCLLNCLFGFFVMPESLSKENRRPFDWRKANPLGSLKFLFSHPGIGSLAFSFFLIYMAVQAIQGNWNFYTAFRFNWTPKMIGISLVVVGVLVGGVQGGLTRVVNPKIGNEKSIYLGLCMYAIGMVLFAFANQSWMMYVFLVPYCLGGLAGPSLQAVISGHVAPNEQGALQGALTSLMSVTTVFGPLIMTGTFSYFSSKSAPFYFPGMHFLLGAFFMIMAVLIAGPVLSKDRRKNPQLVKGGKGAAVSDTPVH